MRSVETLSTNSTKYNTILSTICDMELLSAVYDRENVTELNIANNTENVTELYTANNKENITELNTIYNILLNQYTSLENKNCTYILLEKNVSVQNLYKVLKKCAFVMQAIIQNILPVVVLFVLIVGIKYKFIRFNLFRFFRIARLYYRRAGIHQYMMTPNNVEAGSIWDARQAYIDMLRRRRTREAMRMILYYTVLEEHHDEVLGFNRNQQRQTI